LRRPRGKSSLDLTTAGALSLAAHGCVALALVGVVQLARLITFERPIKLVDMEHAQREVEIELPEVAADSPLVGVEPQAEEAPAAVAGGATVARPDMSQPGRGGDEDVDERALNLANQDDGITRDPSVLSNLEKAQLQRIDAGSARRSWEDMRSSRDPMELTFVAMGRGLRADERRPESAALPARGLRFADRRSQLGADLGGPSQPDGDGYAPRPGAEVLGGPRVIVGLGFVAGPARAEASPALPNSEARPLVAQNDPMVNANDEGRPSDTLDTEQAVEARMQALMHASTMGGTKGRGKGGSGGGGDPAAGGRKGRGSVATALGAGGTGPGDVDRLAYIRAVQSKVHPLWASAFPKWAIAEGLGGTTIVTFVIEADGTVSSAKVTRSSGIPEFDENVRKALVKGAPYGPLPESLKPRLRWSFPFVATNPAVRPKNPKSGATGD
jgi:TonB family protein